MRKAPFAAGFRGSASIHSHGNGLLYGVGIFKKTHMSRLRREFAMKWLPCVSVLVVAMMVGVTGCDEAKKGMDEVKDATSKAASDVSSEVGKINFGDFDMKSIKGKLSGITDGLKNVSSDTVDDVSAKISELTKSLDNSDFGKMSDTAKAAVKTAMSKFGDSVKGAMDKISDDSVTQKLKAAIDPLMEKIKNM